MTPRVTLPNLLASPLVRIDQEPGGHFTAQVVGLPEIQATAATRDAALEQVRDLLAQWLAAGKVVLLAMPRPLSPARPAGGAENDLLEQEFLNHLAQARQQDLEATLREYEQEDSSCSDTSSTPTI